jgi:hypothetical protein
LISNPRDNHGLGHLKESQFLWSMSQMESLSEYQPSLDQESESWAFFAMLTIEKVRGGIFTKPVENTNMTD